MKKSYSLIEILIGALLIALVATFGGLYLFGYWRAKTIEGMAKKIVFYLEFAKTKSIAQENQSGWGVHFENPSSGPSFFSLFYNHYSSTTTLEVIYLPSQIEFSEPSEGNSKEIIFEQLSGKLASTSATSIKIYLKTDPNQTKTIEVNPFGRIQSH